MKQTVKLEVDARAGIRVARVLFALRFVLGRTVATRIASWAAYRLARWRIGGGAWKRGLPAGGQS